MSKAFTTWTDPTTNLTWAIEPNPPQLHWDSARDYPQDVLKDSSFQCATVHQYLTLIEYTKKVVKQAASPLKKNQLYWTANQFAKNIDNVAWLVDTHEGRIYPATKRNLHYALYVRSNTQQGT